MKKMMAGIMAIAMILSLGVHTVDAAEIALHGGHCRTRRTNTNICSECGTTCRFVDADWDGICDHCGTSRRCEGYYTPAI